jgi:hypothetical protein
LLTSINIGIIQEEEKGSYPPLERSTKKFHSFKQSKSQNLTPGVMDKLKLTGQSLSLKFNSTCGHVCHTFQ